MSGHVLTGTRSVATDLTTDGVGLIDFPVDALVPQVVEGWQKFLLKDQKEKLRWCFLDHGNFDDFGGRFEGPDDGYICRKGESRLLDGESYDIKEFFHYKKALPSFLAKARVDTRAETEWLENLKVLHSKCIEEYLAITAELEAHFPGHSLLARAKRGRDFGLPTLRLICYKQAREVGEGIAKMHKDRNWLTLHLADSVRGLVYVKNGERVEYVKEPNRALVFPGKKAEKLLGSALPALNHGVEGVPESIGERRWTVVFFGHIDLWLTPEERSAR